MAILSHTARNNSRAPGSTMELSSSVSVTPGEIVVTRQDSCDAVQQTSDVHVDHPVSVLELECVRLGCLRSEQHMDPWLRYNSAQAASIAELNDLFTRSDCPSR